MDLTYWNKLAPRFRTEVFNVLRSDKNGVVRRTICRYGNKRHTAIDLGCGVGGFLPLLAGAFGEVIAVDWSERCLEQARRACRRLPNIRYVCADIASRKLRLPLAHFAICSNVLLTPERSIRARATTAIWQHLAPGGRLLLVVPSTESSLYATCRLLEWRHRQGGLRFPGRPCRDKTRCPLFEGIMEAGGTLTKHYLKEELVSLLGAAGFDAVGVQKIEYSWRTEFADPPRWMKEPLPWDWLALGTRRAGTPGISGTRYRVGRPRAVSAKQPSRSSARTSSWSSGPQ